MVRVENLVTAVTTTSNLPKAVKITLDKLCEAVNILASEVEELKATLEGVELVDEINVVEKEEVSDEEN